jgi:parallel beta-helix repeat protein
MRFSSGTRGGKSRRLPLAGLAAAVVFAPVLLTAAAQAKAPAPTLVTQSMLPLTITSSGVYQFAGDLSYDGADPITITAPNVDLEGNGHTLSGTGPEGIVSPAADNLTINGVTVKGFDTNFDIAGGHGVTLTGDTAVNGTVGFVLRADVESNTGGFVMSGATASGNSATGIRVDVSGSTSAGSTFGAIVLRNSTATGNGTLGQFQSGGILIETGFPTIENAAHQTTVTVSGNVTNDNAGSGLDIEGSDSGDPELGSLRASVIGNTANGNATQGILVNDGFATVQKNTATSNRGTGIEAGTGRNSLITSNKATGNAPDLADGVPAAVDGDGCANAWANNTFVSDNEGQASDLTFGPKYGCVR